MSMTTERVWEAFHTPLLRFIRRRVPDVATAEDLLQEVFLKIHQRIATLKDVKKLESWVYQITRHVIIDYSKPSAKAPVIDPGDEAPFLVRRGEGSALRCLTERMRPGMLRIDVLVE